MERRVVVTGMGVISPVGNNLTDFWSSLTAGKCGIGLIERFPTDNLLVKIAGEVKGFNPGDYGIDPPTAVRMTDMHFCPGCSQSGYDSQRSQ